MSIRVDKFISSEFVPTIEECEKYCFIVRGVEFQRQAIQTLEELKKKISSIKKSVVEHNDEDAANCCLSLEMAASALQHELKLWIAIKEDRMSDAWDEFVGAESCADAAVCAHKISKQMVVYLQRLENFERLLFPHMIFMSPGGAIISSRCSICGSDYECCDHLKGLPYMGEFCVREIMEVRIQEISLVDKPANKHARMTRMSISGKMHDLLTLRIVSDKLEDHISREHNLINFSKIKNFFSNLFHNQN